MNEYATNLAIVMSKGYRAGLVQPLLDATPESAAILKGMANATDEQIADMNDSWDKVQTEINSFQTTIADAQIHYDDSV